MSRDHNRSKRRPYEHFHVSEVDYEPLDSASAEYTRYPVYSSSEWLLETVTSILSLALLIGIVYIFWSMDNKPLSAWTAPISIGATISIMTTACTAALMYGVSQFIGQIKWLHFKSRPRKLSHLETFDEASRGGIWGCVMLLTTIKWNLATIGAFVTILRLTFAPFAQQVVQFEQRDIISADNGVTFGYTHKYSFMTTLALANSRIESIPQDPNMQSAVLQGLYGNSNPAIFSCPGVCRWPGSYVSLGFKSQCKNVTQETLQSATCHKSSDNVLLQCNMTTPGGLGISTRFVETDLNTNYFMNASSISISQDPRVDLPDTFPEIARFAIYRSTSDGLDFHPVNINITECSLSLAAYEYIDASANGSEFSFGKTHVVDFGGTNPWKRADSADPWGLLYTNESKTDNIPAFEILYPSLVALSNFLKSEMFVSEFVEGNFENKNLGLAAALSGDVDLDERFEKMATSMTDYLRHRQEAEAAHGEIIESQPFVSIRWLYLIPPIVTELVAILFAVLTIFSNRKSRHVPLWKSSVLAVLACQWKKQQGILQSAVKDIKEFEESARNTEVQLQ